MLRAKTLDCATLMGAAVGKEKFYGDAMVLVQILDQIDPSTVEDDDQQMPYIYGWCGRGGRGARGDST